MNAKTLNEKFKLIPTLTSFFTIAVSGTLVFIWLFLPALKEFSANSMKFNTSLSLLFTAISLYLLKDISELNINELRYKIGKFFALAVLLIGSLTFIEYLSGFNFNIDQLLVSDFSNLESQLHPGRMAPVSALAFIFLGISLLTQDFKIKKTNIHIPSLFLFPVLFIGFQAITGYLYQVSALYTVGVFIRIAWPTAFCFVILPLGILFSRPQDGPLSAITSDKAGGEMARRLLPYAFLLPVTLGWLRLQGQYAGLFDLEQGLAIFVVTLSTIFISIILLNANGLNLLGAEREHLIERKRLARKEVELEREKLHSLFLQAPAIISIMRGPDHVFELFNNEARKTVSGKDFTGLTIRDALPNLAGKGFFEALDNAYKTGNPILLQEILADLKQNDGSFNQHYFNVIYQPWRNPHGDVAGILNISVDVTEQVLARHKVEHALQTRDEFISMASHELKTPITSLKMRLQLTRREINPELGIVPSPDKLLKLLDTSDKQMDRLITLIENMLDIVRIQAGKLHFDFKSTDLNALVGHIVDEQFTKSLAGAKKAICIRIDEPIIAQWDPLRIEQVILNLLTNAIKYAPDSNIEIRAKKVNDRVEIIVQDWGPGISKENQTQLFQRFVRPGITRNINGLGLGLHISKQIIESHGGIIRIDSEEGQGASFIIELPIVATEHKLQE